MDFNDVLLQAMLTHGRYDTKTMQPTRAHVYMNHFVAIIELFCTIKMVIILLVPWNKIEIVLYLIDLYIVNRSLLLSCFQSASSFKISISFDR